MLKKTYNFIKKRKRDSNTGVFPEHFRTYFKKHFTSEQLLLTLLLNSKNLLTSYEQLSYYQFNVKQIKTYELVFYKEKIDSC